MRKEFNAFKEFYPFYLSEHKNPINRKLHFAGSFIGLILFLGALITTTFQWILYGLIIGYAFAWVGHFVFEKNKPATFQYPLFSFLGDWKMFFDLLTHKISFDASKDASS